MCLTLNPTLQDLAGRHVFKVEPLNAILDPQYFVRAVHGCVMAVMRERSQAPWGHAAESAGIRRASLIYWSHGSAWRQLHRYLIS